MRVTLTKEFTVESAHRTQDPQAGGGLHGHSLRIVVGVAGDVDEAIGWLMDYNTIKQRFQPLRDLLDHHYVNEIEGLTDPSLEGIARWIEERLAPDLPGLAGVWVSVVGDNRYSPAYLPADEDLDLPARLRFTFEAAQSLPQLDSDHPCRRLHGHSYRIEVGAGDLERLEPRLNELYDELDHRCLNDIPGLQTATTERLAMWIWERLLPRIDDLMVVVVQETATTRCIYRGE